MTPSCVVDMLLEVLLIAHVFGLFPSNCCVAASEPVLIVRLKIKEALAIKDSRRDLNRRIEDMGTGYLP